LTRPSFTLNLIALRLHYLREAATSVFGVANDLAGLLLVFIGYVYARGEGFRNVRHGDQFKHVAKAGIVPFVTLLVCSWFALNYIQGGATVDYQIAMFLFRASIALIAWYAFVVLFVYL
jgi:hypothetical protein